MWRDRKEAIATQIQIASIAVIICLCLMADPRK